MFTYLSQLLIYRLYFPQKIYIYHLYIYIYINKNETKVSSKFVNAIQSFVFLMSIIIQAISEIYNYLYH